MRGEGKLFKADGLTLLELAEILLIAVVLVAMLVPVITHARSTPDRDACQSNLKELALSMQMYWNDYDTMLPSSFLHRPQGADIWDPVASAEFCAELGVVPPPAYPDYQDKRYVQVLWPYMRRKGIIWCPSDPTAGERGSSRFHVTPAPDALVSYIYKPAVDRAWFGVPTSEGTILMRRENDLEYPDSQVMFFERLGWHWGGHNRGWQDGISFNVAFMDGHVCAVRLINSAGIKAPKTAAEFADALSLPGEPLWYNFNAVDGITDTAVWFNPHTCYDRFP